MSVTEQCNGQPALDIDRPAIICSIDSHAGPRLVDDLRPYCPPEHLDAFDEFASLARPNFTQMFGMMLEMTTDPDERADLEKQASMFERNAGPGHYDVSARLADMDRDGIATEVIFHSSQNGEPMPFVPAMGAEITWEPADATAETRTLVAVGQHIYNSWLADFCGAAPDRLLGAASIPLWDTSAAIAELEWAGAAGLRAVNFPAPRLGLPEFDDPVLEPFWSAAASLDMPLLTHAGAAFTRVVPGPQMTTIMEIEGGGWPSRRGLGRMIFGGVFERHPGLRLVLAEQAGDWWTYVTREMDSSWHTHRASLKAQVPRPPSEYLRENVFIGASFTAPFEAAAAVEGGYEDNLLWGRDYPHIEGTFQNLPDDQPNMTHLSLRHGFARLPSDKVAKMVAGNLVRLFGLDPDALAHIAGAVGAPTLRELGQPIDAIPELGGVFAFRTIGAWG